MHRLEAAVTRPQAAAHAADGAQRDDQEQAGRSNPGELVQRRCRLQVLDDGSVGRHEAADMHDNRAQRAPAQERVQAQRQESRRRGVARPHRHAAQRDAGKAAGEAGQLREFPDQARMAGERGHRGQCDEPRAPECVARIVWEVTQPHRAILLRRGEVLRPVNGLGRWAIFTAKAMPISEKRGSMMFSQCAGLDRATLE